MSPDRRVIVISQLIVKHVRSRPGQGEGTGIKKIRYREADPIIQHKLFHKGPKQRRGRNRWSKSIPLALAGVAQLVPCTSRPWVQFVVRAHI